MPQRKICGTFLIPEGSNVAIVTFSFWYQLGGFVLRILVAVVAFYSSQRFVRYLDVRAKLRSDAQTALRLEQLSKDIKNLRERPKSQAAG